MSTPLWGQNATFYGCIRVRLRVCLEGIHTWGVQMTTDKKPYSVPPKFDYSLEKHIRPEEMTDKELAAQSFIPFLNGDGYEVKKGEYITYRYTGFPAYEACRLTGVHFRTILKWRNTDPRFRELEEAASGPQRANIRREIVHLLFLRNMHLMLKKDYDVLTKALGVVRRPDGEPYVLSKADQDYLAKARAHYTPAQLQTLETLMERGTEQGFDVSSFILKASQAGQEVTVQAAKVTIKGDRQLVEALSDDNTVEGVPDDAQGETEGPADTERGEQFSEQAEYLQGTDDPQGGL